MSTSKTAIEWTDATWNPVRGCSRVSEGCRNCYAERVAARFSGPGKPFHGFAEAGRAGSLWTGKVALVPEALDQPLRWRKPKRIFVNSMSDLFHEGLSEADIADVFTVMAVAKHHTFQVLTKRPARMKAWFEMQGNTPAAFLTAGQARPLADWTAVPMPCADTWPLPNVWLGVSVEDQHTADERIPLLLETPAAKRFVSYEPALGQVDFGPWLGRGRCDETGCGCGAEERPLADWPLGPDGIRRCSANGCAIQEARGLDQIIVGGESGPGARPFDLAWARSVVEQCRAAGVACFVKQLGACPILNADPLPVPQSAESRMRHGEYDPDPFELKLQDRKGADMSEWPEDLRVREVPA